MRAQRPRRHATGTLCAAAGLSVVLGIWIHSGLTAHQPASNTVAVPAPTVTVTKTVYRDKPVQVPTMPEDCARAVQLIIKMQDPIATVTSSGSRQSDILSEAHVAILSKDVSGLTKAGSDQNQLLNEVSGARRDVNDGMADLSAALDHCNATLQNKPR